MEYSIEYGRAYPVLKVWLEPGESITVEPGAYMLHKGRIRVNTSSGGVFRGIARALFGGSSFFLNTVVAETSVEIWIAPLLPGDIAVVELAGRGLYVQDSSYLAHIGDIEVGVGWRGFRGFFAEKELVWLKLEGSGIAFINSFGAIDKLELGYGEKIVVDNMHFVALDETVKWRVKKWGGWKTFFFGGEGIVVEAEGPGRVWVQTRSFPPLASLVEKYISRS